MKRKTKGFTLAELLIVVAIIAVLVAVAIPVFTAQLNKAKYATLEANARSMYAVLVADYMSNGTQTIHCEDEIYQGGDNYNGINYSNCYTTDCPGTMQLVSNDDSSVIVESFEYNGMTNIFIIHDGERAPAVVVAACEYNDDTDVVFGNPVNVD